MKVEKGCANLGAERERDFKFLITYLFSKIDAEKNLMDSNNSTLYKNTN